MSCGGQTLSSTDMARNTAVVLGQLLSANKAVFRGVLELVPALVRQLFTLTVEEASKFSRANNMSNADRRREGVMFNNLFKVRRNVCLGDASCHVMSCCHVDCYVMTLNFVIKSMPCCDGFVTEPGLAERAAAEGL